MRKIAMWLAATVVVVAMATYYQVNLTSDGHGGAHEPAAVQAAESPTPEPDATTEDESATEGTEAAEDDKADDPYADSDHTGKPGESKD